MTTTLTFQNTPLEMVTHDGVIWISAPELAKALDYKRSDSISRIYDRNKDEFTSDMTETVKLTVSGNLQKETRIFSLRGAHLVAMFARSKVAKDFRKWVLNVLDGTTALSHFPVVVENKNKFYMDEREIMRLVWIWFAAETMRETIGEIEPALRRLGLSLASPAYAQNMEYKHTARSARKVLLHLTENIHYNKHDRGHYALEQLLKNFSEL